MPDFYDFMIDKYFEDLRYTSDKLPTDCHNVDGIVDSFKQACELYKYSMPETSAKMIVAFIVDYEEANVCDQKHLESALFKKHRITCRRLTFADIYKNCELTENGQLIYKQKEEIAVVYYRSGYGPHQYADKNIWEARKILEVSKAIK